MSHKWFSLALANALYAAVVAHVSRPDTAGTAYCRYSADGLQQKEQRWKENTKSL